MQRLRKVESLSVNASGLFSSLGDFPLVPSESKAANQDNREHAQYDDPCSVVTSRRVFRLGRAERVLTLGQGLVSHV
jgi:hypothetical protein